MRLNPKQQRNLIESVKEIVIGLVLKLEDEHKVGISNWDKLTEEEQNDHRLQWFLKAYGMEPEKFAMYVYNQMVKGES